jgi:hypothetical protein
MAARTAVAMAGARMRPMLLLLGTTEASNAETTEKEHFLVLRELRG